MATVKLPMAPGTLPMASGTPRFPVLRTALTLVLLAVLGWSFGVATVWAQKAGDAKGGLTKAEFMQILRNKNIPDKAAFDSYVTKEITSPFGISGPPADRLYKLRYQLKIFLNTARTGQAHDELNRMTLARMKEIVGGSKYDSAAKVNAMIVIGELNDVDEPGKGKPLPEAFPLLWAVTHSPKFKDELKIAAMLGLDRFAAAGTLQKKDEVAKLMLALVKQKDPPPKRSPDGHNWMRRQAAAILVKMGGGAANTEVVNAIAAIAADPTARPTMRCEMAQLIGQSKLTPAAKVDVQLLAGSLGHLAVDICNAELDEAQQEKRDLKMRLIMYTLYSVREALGGLQGAAADTPHKKLVGDLYNKVKSIHAELDDPELSTNTMAADVAKKIKELQGMLPAKAPVAAQEVAAAPAEKKPVESAKQ
jgi:hypothetical protein